MFAGPSGPTTRLLLLLATPERLRERPHPLACGPPRPRARTRVRAPEVSGRRPLRQLPARAREVAGVAVGDALQVVLVLGLGLPEGAGRRDLGDHLARPQARGVDVGDGVLGDPLLLVARCRRSPSGSSCRRRCPGGSSSLGSWIWKKNSSSVAVADLRRVEDDLDRLGVGAVVAVGGVGHVAAGVADAGGDHAGLAADQVLHAPEAAAGEDCGFGGHVVSLLSSCQPTWAREYRHSPGRPYSRSLHLTLDCNVQLTGILLGSRRIRP